jgi:hypothetical protein
VVAQNDVGARFPHPRLQETYAGGDQIRNRQAFLSGSLAENTEGDEELRRIA